MSEPGVKVSTLTTDPVRATIEPSTHSARGNRMRRRGRGLTITLAVSLGLHVAAVTAALLLLHAAPVIDAPDKPTEVELVMEEHAGNAQPTASPAAPPVSAPSAAAAKPVEMEKPSDKTAPPEKPAKKPAEKPAAPATIEASAADSPSPPLPAPVEARPDTPKETAEPVEASDPTPASAAAEAGEARQAEQSKETFDPASPSPPAAQIAPSPPAAQQAPTPPAAQQAPTPPAAQQAPTITLSGTDSPSDARAWGDRIIPAAPDAVFHNRPPEYPEEAARNGEHGTVILLIHVSPAGTTAGVDVTRSSGYVLLDRAAREAVLRWRFLPAVKDGQPVASEMSMGFVFDY